MIQCNDCIYDKGYQQGIQEIISKLKEVKPWCGEVDCWENCDNCGERKVDYSDIVEIIEGYERKN